MKPGVVACNCDPNIWEVEAEDQDFEVSSAMGETSLGYLRFSTRFKKKYFKVWEKGSLNQIGGQRSGISNLIQTS